MSARRWRNDDARYGIVSITLHWGVALVILTMLATAAWVWIAPNDDIAGDRLRVHGALGALALPLLALRIIWHFVERRPASLARPPLDGIARAVHALLLVLIAAQLLTGPIDIWSGGWPIGVFGWFAIPSPLGGVLRAWHDPIGDVHRFTGYAIAALVGLHVAAAFKHLLIDCDDTLPRMLGFDEPVANSPRDR